MKDLGVLADALIALFNPQATAWWYAPAANAIESHVLRFLCSKVGFDSETSAAHFTSGGSEANMTGVVAALTRSFPRVSVEGLRSLGLDPCIYASDQAHDSFIKIARTIGLGTAAVRRIPTDASARLDTNLVADAIARDRAAGRAPFLVIATAGTTGSGAIDPIPELASLCQRESLWLHIDAAWGGLALLSQSHRDLLRGIEQADSVTWDLHKVLPVPMGAGALFCRDRAPLAAAFNVTPKYVPAERPGAIDLYRQSLLWSRRALGLKVLMVIAERGELGIEALVDHVFAMGDLLRQSLVDAGVEVINASTKLPLVCLAPPQGQSAKSLVEVISRDANAWVSEVHLPDDRVGRRTLGRKPEILAKSRSRVCNSDWGVAWTAVAAGLIPPTCARKGEEVTKMIFPDISVEDWIARHPGLKKVSSHCPTCSRKIMADKPFIDPDYFGLTNSPCLCGDTRTNCESLVTRTEREHLGWLDALSF